LVELITNAKNTKTIAMHCYNTHEPSTIKSDPSHGHQRKVIARDRIYTLDALHNFCRHQVRLVS